MVEAVVSLSVCKVLAVTIAVVVQEVWVGVESGMRVVVAAFVRAVRTGNVVVVVVVGAVVVVVVAASRVMSVEGKGVV